MNLLKRMARRREQDRAREQKHRIARNTDQSYTTADVQRLTEERAPWMKRRRG